MADVKCLVNAKMASISATEWSKCVDKVKTIEEQYRKANIAVEQEIDKVIINLEDSSEDEDTDTCDEYMTTSTVTGSDTAESVDTSTDTADEMFTVVQLH